MTIATDEAVQMLMAGWRVEYYAPLDAIIWHAPDGRSGHGHSESLDSPPIMAVEEARRRGDIVDRPRVLR